MIPILYGPEEKDFKTNGLGRLKDCARFEVTEERNGIYECEFDYPMTGEHFSEILDGCFVYATHDNSGKPQPFQIYKRSAPIKGIVTFNAWHISYALKDMVVKPFEATSCAQALQRIPTNTIGENRFTFWTDKAVAGDYKLKEPRAIRATLGGQQGSILDVYGKGDYEFDMYAVKLYVDRGSDRGVSIRYGKNMSDLQQTLDASGILNGVVPYWSSTDGEVVYLPYAVLGRVDRVQDLPLITHDLEPILTEAGLEILAQYADLRIGVLDLSGDFDEEPTPAQLEAKARSYMQGSTAYQLKENLTIDFVQLWQTEEYKDFASLQRIFLCDTVHIYHERLGINATAKCIKVVYDTLKERYKLMELGEPKTTLNQQIADVSRAIIEAETADLPDTAAMQKAIKHATEMITGGLGGYVVIAEGENGYPEEILIMDTPDKNTAINVWRFNKGGLGHSHSGYNGPFNDVALTADGQINANMITTGAINAALVDVINLSASNITTGTLNAARIAANSIAVSKLTGQIANNNWVIDLTNGTLTIGNISADNINTGTLNAARIGTGSIAMGKLDNATQTAITDAGANASTALNAANGANSREQIIYRSAVSGTTTMAANTTWVTASGNTQNAWTTRRPVYSSSYPVLFVATQRQSVEHKKAGSTCDCTTPVIDQTTTVIDGGHITTGTIDAGVVNVTNINANNITAGTITDASGKNSWNLNTGQFITKQGKIGDFTIDDNGLKYATSDSNRVETKLYPTQISLDKYTNGAIDKGIAITPDNITMVVMDGQMPNIYLNLAGYMLNGQPTATLTNYIASLVMSGASIEARGNFSVATGYSKNKILQTDNYGERALYCYETPSPFYGDIGEGEIGADGVAYIWLDPIFAETIKTEQYQVQLQAYGQGECYVAERAGAYFKVVGTAGLPFGWELKAKQGDLGDKRLDAHGNEFTPPQSRYGDLAAEHIAGIHEGRITA